MSTTECWIKFNLYQKQNPYARIVFDSLYSGIGTLPNMGCTLVDFTEIGRKARKSEATTIYPGRQISRDMNSRYSPTNSPVQDILRSQENPFFMACSVSLSDHPGESVESHSTRERFAKCH